MSASYTGLHGRSPYEPDNHSQRGEHSRHFVPEGWEDLDRGICPGCGKTVSWDAGNEMWRVRRNLNVVLLFDNEVIALEKLYEPNHDSALLSKILQQVELNRPFDG